MTAADNGHGGTNLMRTVDIIQRKRDGCELTTEEINFLIQGYTDGSIPDYQVSAWAMAVFYKGMTAKETADLTLAMVRSGEQVDLSSIQGIKVDKHSTGGVGDTTTLVLAPLAASAGVPVAKMSGRGLGHTGGTIDKLEAIEGFQVELTQQAFIDQMNTLGVAVISQTGNITPADKKLYGLRDVTATVNSIPLIASSIMSKKIASGADAIVLDVKTGHGAFMKTLDESIQLAQAMVEIGEQVGRETIAIISDMDQPLGYAIGNALEVREAILTLQGQGPKDLEELCLELGSQMLVLGKQASDAEHAREKLNSVIQNGNALDKLRQLVEAQQGNGELISNIAELPLAEQQIEVLSPQGGMVHSIEAETIGVAAMMLGAGRETKDSVIDLSVGIELKKKVGDTVAKDEPLAVLYVNPQRGTEVNRIVQMVTMAYTVRSENITPPPLIYAIITKDGVKKLH
jgi:pyrimidine-nucleoside phosphorylase